MKSTLLILSSILLYTTSLAAPVASEPTTGQTLTHQHHELTARALNDLPSADTDIDPTTPALTKRQDSRAASERELERAMQAERAQELRDYEIQRAARERDFRERTRNARVADAAPQPKSKDDANRHQARPNVGGRLPEGSKGPAAKGGAARGNPVRAAPAGEKK